MKQPCWGFVLGSLALIVVGALLADDPLTDEQAALKKGIERLNAEGIKLFNAGQFTEALARMEKVPEMLERLHPAKSFPNGHPDVAAAFNNLAIAYQTVGQFDKAQPHFERALAMRRRLYPPATHPNGHEELAGSLNDVGIALDSAGAYKQAIAHFEEALTMFRRLFPEKQHPHGHASIAMTLTHLGSTWKMMGNYERARAYHEQALAMFRQLFPADKFPNGHPRLAINLNDLGLLLNEMGEHDGALLRAREAMEMYRRLHPPLPDQPLHPNVGLGVNNVGLICQSMGAYEKALPLFEEAVALFRRAYPANQYPAGHTDLATALNNLANLHERLGALDRAQLCHEEALTMFRGLYPKSSFPQGHPALTRGLNNLGIMHTKAGAHDKALSYLEEALTLRRAQLPKDKYPNGHPLLALSLSNLGGVLDRMGAPTKARAYHEQALRMYEQLYPPEKYPAGHPDLAETMHLLAGVVERMTQHAEAITLYEKTLAMYQRLYPESKYPAGHPHLARCLSDLGVSHAAKRSYGHARTYYEQSLAMYERLFPLTQFPDGYPDASICRANLAGLYYETAQLPKALELYEQAIQQARRQIDRQIEVAPEADALALLLTQSLKWDGYLSTSRLVPDAAERTYREIWSKKAAVTRVLERRHRAARVALADPKGEKAIKDQWEQLQAVSRRISQTLTETDVDAARRDRDLRELLDRKERLERNLAAVLPELDRQRERARQTPGDLARQLPPRTALVDFVQYHPEPMPGAASRERVEPAYIAFIVASGARQPIRVELGSAKPIDTAINAWRSAIERNATSPAAEELSQQVWRPIAKHLPADVRTVYLATDGDLARLPWGALPGAQPGRVLLEDHAFAVVPHGPFLLDQLRRGAAPVDVESFLVLGGVSFGSSGSAQPSGYAALPGTASETEHLAVLAGSRRVTKLTGSAATPSALLTELPKSRYVHLATHGYFNERALAAERKRVMDNLRGYEFRAEAAGQRIGLGLRSPLGYTGLVLAGANQSEAAGILTGEALVTLSLDRVELVTLSACETGLGELTAGEGVFGLTRAFHLAGCPNVVASLWKVNDAATAALMVKFYHELWVNKKPPIDALREAQLTIYRRPDLIPILATERGLKLEKAVATASAQAAPADKGTAPTKLWAAFVLSGVGK